MKQAILDEKYSEIVKLALEQHLQSNTSLAGDMVHVARKTIWEEQAQLADVKIGDWVEVLYEYLPGTCSDGGVGVITRLMSVDEGIGTVMTLFATVRYVLDNRKEHSVTMDRLTIIPMPYKTTEVQLRPRVKIQAPKHFQKVVEKRTPLGWLKWGLTTRKHEKKGWLAETLIENGELIDGDDAIWRRVLSDYRCQLAFLEGMKEVLADKYKDPRDVKGIQGTNSGGKFVSLKKDSQSHVPKNVHSLGYLLYAYGVSKTTFFRKRDAEKVGINAETKWPAHVRSDAKVGPKTAIDCRSTARDFYNPRFFFAREKAMGTTILLDKQGKVHPGWTTYQTRHKHWGKVYDDEIEQGTDMSRYERMEREHDARQPFVEQDLIEALQSNVCRSYRQLSKHINGWCCAGTVEIWLKNHTSYHLYAKNIKPGLSVENRAKQVAFSQHVHNKWGLGAEVKKILWVMCDEKWFHGLVPRANAKSCEELGIHKQTYSAHHKKHIAKVMVHCTVAYCFEGEKLTMTHIVTYQC